MKRKIFVVDDHDITLQGYTALIDAEPDLRVCGQARSAAEALAAIPEAGPDLAVVDVSLGDMSGIELIKHLEALMPDLPILVVSMHDETLYAERALRAGANGYIMKSEAHTTVAEAIRHVLDGGLYLSARMNEKMLLRYMNRPVPEAPPSPLEQLTDRELETFRLIGRGLSTQQIAETMCISPKTVGTYRGRIKSKLALETTAKLVQRAVQWVQEEAAAG